MTRPHARHSHSGHESHGPANDLSGDDVPPPAPRWVKLFLLATLAVALVFAIVHLAGRGLHGH